MRSGGSLAARLVWRLVGLQAVIVLMLIVMLTWSLGSAMVSSINESVPRTVADAVRVDRSGQLALADTAALRALLRVQPGLWFAVADERGHQLVHGDIPQACRGLAAALAQLWPSEIHDGLPPYRFTMRIVVVDTPAGRVHVLAGGAPSAARLVMLAVIASYLGWRVALPLALVTLLIMPWTIRRAMAGVAKVAAQAQAIDIDERGARLADHAVPLELQPLVRAFNAALVRLGEGYDARDRFLASAAHELRAPIAILAARLETLQDGAVRTRLLADVARLSNLAEQLLDLQRLGRQEVALAPLDLVALAREVAADAAPLVIGAGYQFALDAPRVPVMVLGDVPSLSRVLTNLVQNAVEHAGGHGQIAVEVLRDGGFEVRDQGPGIPTAERARIFEPFHRLRPRNEGAGLGLHLVREIVARHGGRIEVVDVPGSGACFRVRLRPVADEAGAGQSG